MNEALLATMTGDLTRRGYLAALNTSCATACDGCGIATACAPGELSAHASILTLIAKGQRAAGALHA